MIFAQLVHIGQNIRSHAEAISPLACDDNEWRLITDNMAAKGLNTILVDLLEGVRYDSHPEIAIPGAWSTEKLRKELARLRTIGLEPVPMINFSAMHDEWLGIYGRMVSTPEYYRVCEDIIREVIALFDTPRFVDIGYDEEDARNQAAHELLVIRQGELWWHDFLWFVKTVEKYGSRCCVSSDWMWEHHDEFLRRCPKSVIQCNWYYDSVYGERSFRWPRIKCYEDLEKAGFDQLPWASNWVCPTNMEETYDYIRATVSDKHLLGFVQSSWFRTLPEAHAHARTFAATEQMARCIARYKKGFRTSAWKPVSDGKEAFRRRTCVRPLRDIPLGCPPLKVVHPGNEIASLRPVLVVCEGAITPQVRQEVLKWSLGGHAYAFYTSPKGDGSIRDTAKRAEEILDAARALAHANAGKTVELIAEGTAIEPTAWIFHLERPLFSAFTAVGDCPNREGFPPWRDITQGRLP